MPKFFGTPDGVQVGQLFVDRRDLHDHLVHRPLQGGISGTKLDGADSIVISGGYVDDEDHGNFIIYTGHGGNDANTKKQVADQSVEAPGNAGLITSWVRGLPVRVTRGARSSAYAPPVGFQYAGLFIVVDSWVKKGNNGFQIIQFRLERIEEQDALFTPVAPEIDPAYQTTTVTRRIRDSAISREVKRIYDDHCQVCGIRINGIGGRGYSEGAHVRPIGRPHLGADTLANLLCLCPNHHTQLDFGGMFILDDWTVADRAMMPFADLQVRENHPLEVVNARYHRDHWAGTASAKGAAM